VKGNVFFVVSTLVLSIASLGMELVYPGTVLSTIAWYLDFAIVVLLIAEVTMELRSAGHFKAYLKQNGASTVFLLIFLVLFVYTKSIDIAALQIRFGGISRGVIVLRNLFIILKVFSRIKKLSTFFEGITTKPSQTILLSFLMVILTGSLVLMLPFTTVAHGGIHFIDALFTATSAVCVTGLIVVDTATYFTLWGQLVILVLIQIGGLSIMAISYFTLFSIRQKVSVQDKLLLSYMLNENNISLLSRRLRTIIMSTFIIEAIGALFLLLPFRQTAGNWSEALLLSVFHSVSAFCNAGFSLFSTSLEGFLGNPAVNFTIALLIIAGGISFAVITDLFRILKLRIKALFVPVAGARELMSLNTYVVACITPVLIIAGMLLIYGLEHNSTLASLPLGQQYLAAFFQSVTLRTAGFNTIPIGDLTTTTLLVMIPFMFIGAASGSTAGGIKINNLAVMYGYLKSILLNRDSVTIRRSSLSRTQVNKAFLVFLFGVFSITFGTIILSATEEAELANIMFEVVSAFGTVGLSTGITPVLSAAGKIVIVVLMFIGRLGPLTILAAAAQPEKRIRISFPRGDVML
jgi:trk system potassium uptake protein TrkH